MTNDQIIFKAAAQFLGIDEAEAASMVMLGKFPAFHTYEGWKAEGYQVQKGEKSLFSAKIWKMTEKKTDDGNKLQKMIMKNSHFFGFSQVKPIQ